MDILCNNINCNGIGMRRADWDNFRECQDIVLNGQVIWQGPVLSSAVKSQIYTEYAANPTLAAQVWKAANVYAKAHPAMIDTINANPTWYWGDFTYYYQQCEWTKGNGNQYFKVPFNTTNGFDKFDVDYIPTGNGWSIIGTWISGQGAGYNLDMNGQWRFWLGFGNGALNLKDIFTGLSVDNEVNLSYKRNDGTLTVNEQTISYTQTSIPSSLQYMFVFALGFGSSVQNYYSTSKIKKIYAKSPDSEINLLSCYNKTSQIIGMFDVVNGVFYTNQGTGTFTKGADI